MSASTKLSTAVKALCYLGSEPIKSRNSAEISNHIDVNASKLRKILSMLVKNEILKSEQGANGGFVFNKDTNQIHLQEIYCAIEDRKAFHLDVKKDKTISNNQNIWFYHRVTFLALIIISFPFCFRLANLSKYAIG